MKAITQGSFQSETSGANDIILLHLRQKLKVTEVAGCEQ